MTLQNGTQVNSQPVMSDPRLLHALTLRRLLLFGPETVQLKLRSLNVLIGPNGSGKSNLLEAVALLRATPNRVSPNDLRTVLGRGGGVGEWF